MERGADRLEGCIAIALRVALALILAPLLVVLVIWLVTGWSAPGLIFAGLWWAGVAVVPGLVLSSAALAGARRIPVGIHPAIAGFVTGLGSLLVASWLYRPLLTLPGWSIIAAVMVALLMVVARFGPARVRFAALLLIATLAFLSIFVVGENLAVGR